MAIELRRIHGVLAALSLFLIAGVYPFESTVVPKWRLEVRDISGNLCRNMRVTQSWGHYSLFIDGNDQGEDRYTDSLGIVEFPERNVRAIGLRRVVLPIITHILVIAHGSVGPSGTVWASGLKDVAWLSYKPGYPLPENMRVEQCIAEN